MFLEVTDVVANTDPEPRHEVTFLMMTLAIENLDRCRKVFGFSDRDPATKRAMYMSKVRYFLKRIFLRISTG